MDSDAVYRPFGDLVRKHRKRLHLTQDSLGEKVGLTRTSITNIEGGRQKVLLHQVIALAEALEVSAEALLPRHTYAGPVSRLKRRLPKHLSEPERNWIHGIVGSPSKEGDESHAERESENR